MRQKLVFQHRIEAGHSIKQFDGSELIWTEPNYAIGTNQAIHLVTTNGLESFWAFPEEVLIELVDDEENCSCETCLGLGY